MVWTKPTYSGTRRTKAGLALAGNRETPEDLIVIDNWRSSHAPPLQTIKMLLKRRAKSVDADATVAQRLKRLSSIRAKLQRESIRLQQMQDLGGCRAIVKNMASLRKLTKIFDSSFEKNPKRPDLKRHSLVDKKDYISSPKPDGYRSVHYVLSYQTLTPYLECYNGHLIEVQIRTRLQHAWATAVEIVDAFTGQSLKSALRTNIGDATWRRFFAVSASAFALREKTSLITGVASEPRALRGDLRQLVARTNVVHVLRGLSAGVKLVGNVSASAKSYVLTLDMKKRVVTVMQFDEESQAQAYLFKQEREVEANPNLQVVQVSVEKMQALRTAYPNYYLDTSYFISALDEATLAKDA
jgi:ppGpp synthetase/RelA/SpoT-type nucleotidyltranferase